MIINSMSDYDYTNIIDVTGILSFKTQKKEIQFKLSHQQIYLNLAAIDLTQFELLSLESSYHLASVKIEIGGSRDHLLFFKLSDEVTIYVDLENISLDQVKSEYLPIKKLKKNNKNQFFAEWLIIFLFIAMVFGIVYYRAPIAGQLSQMIPFSLEKKMGDKVFLKEISEKLAPVIKIENKLNAIVEEIDFFKQNKNKFTIHFSADSQLNAYATVGGHIFINKGLLKELDTPEQLLGVVAHEMVHADKRHVVKSLFQSAGLFLVIQTLMGDISGLIAILADTGGPLLNLSYSRDLESEADKLGAIILLESGIDSSGLGEALNIIEKEMKLLIQQQPGSEILEKITQYNFLRSHPQTQNRIKNLEDVKNKWLSEKKIQNVIVDSKTKTRRENKWKELKLALDEI